MPKQLWFPGYAKDLKCTPPFDDLRYNAKSIIVENNKAIIRYINTRVVAIINILNGYSEYKRISRNGR